MRVNVKYKTILFGFVMGGFTSFIISAVLTLVNSGTGDFLIHWLRNWMIALSLAVPIATFIPPIVGRKIARITEEC
ncbi:DUF2798 domain-containing protein [Pelosinus sp. sgz500959]|uniref:DUF2798 domain-containing protein n=1 Tax=Pelosinus sp. sgz500959 TaxID=3242472 RepID=UPI00366CA5FB